MAGRAVDRGAGLERGARRQRAAPAPAAVGDDSVIETICALIDSSARAQDLPVVFLTRLIWQESNFHTDAVSPAGARGIAQFMPATAGARGLADPVRPGIGDPQGRRAAGGNAQAVRQPRPRRRRLQRRARPGRQICRGAGRSARRDAGLRLHHHPPFRRGMAHQRRQADRRGGVPGRLLHAERRQVPPLRAGHLRPFAVLRALGRADFRLVQQGGGAAAVSARGSQLCGDSRRPAAHGAGGAAAQPRFRPYYRVRAPAASRQEAEALCAKLEKIGGACVVLRSA